MVAPLTNAPEFTVSELAGAVKRAVEDEFGHVRVRGEISGFRGVHSSGHAYFTLKDENASIDAVVWKGTWPRLAFKPEEGMEVIVTGRMTTFPRSSKYQIVIEQLEPAGAGALMALLEARRKALAAEGLFAAERKRELPYLPRTIGVITSPTGAVIRDILHRISDRFPSHVIVWPVRVQGETAAAEVTAAINGFNALRPDGPIARPDVLIVARGGGSIEDLWGFNEEIVVRAVAASRIPVITAVGHETDTTLVDYASDHRAPTPTAAAEAAVPVRADLIGYVDEIGGRQRHAMRRTASNYRDRLRAAAAGLPRPLDLVASARQRLDHAASNLAAALRHTGQRKRIAFERVSGRLSPNTLRGEVRNLRARLTPAASRLAPALARMIDDRRKRLEAAGKLLEAVSYKNILDRGFAVVTDLDGRIVKHAAQVNPGDPLHVQVSDGTIGVTVGGAPGPRKRIRPPPGEDNQGSLF
ncbi:exodeoxyribonuclease VII large subunit [Devosia sp.]|uniref:exodeoxyribonuclease VII large subunit n=1 Tax=Devosia sp. TaxID=1871048 RepID=UPI001AC6030B|nr:exodeoxyribonuclease VII large subunit [Devosia sp.]MBN9307898.1 exodeoxyribonuclease VII large subunit [Devosia sp.]